MKKFYFWSILILFILVLLPAGLWAQNNTQRSASDSRCEQSTYVTAAQAMDVGYAFMRTGSGSKSGDIQSSNVRKQAMQLIYTGRATDTLTRSTIDCYYVFALQPKGFVIVAADNRVEPILGYSYDNNFVIENMPEHIRGWLNDFENQIEVVSKSARPAEADIQTKWTRLESGQPLSNTRNGNTVGPLLTTTWDQTSYYNALCPEDVNGPGGHVPTGCVATAMAQIINYWSYPAHGRGTHSYDSYYGTLTVNYDSVYYDYTNMPASLTVNSTPAEINAVATLMYHCGVAINMFYSASASGAFDFEARASLVNFFRFSPNLSYALKADFSDEQWNNMLQENIAADIPVMYSGSEPNGRHTFVCDGYNSDNYYHFNFGWSGNNDGWYRTTVINPSNYRFNTGQTALVGIVPDSTGNVILGQLTGTSTFYVDEPLEFSHLLGHNTYTNYINYPYPCNNNVLFTSADTAKQLVLDILSYEDQTVTIYDGYGGNQLNELNYGAENNLSPIVSTAHALSIAYQGNLYYSGFGLSISQENACRMVSNIVTSVDTTCIHLAWIENGSATQWQIEYDTAGFIIGNGTNVTVSTNNIDLTGFSKFTYYDIYIRSVCDENHYGLWNKVKVRTEAPYWHEIVSEMPAGYLEDNDGNITISTAEGLAWFARKTLKLNDYNGKHVILTADIDLSQYRWAPILFENSSFDGTGHTIENVVIIEHGVRNNNSVGFWGNVKNSTIKNFILKNIDYDYDYMGNLGYGSVGGIVGSTFQEDSLFIINCLVQGKIKGGSITGGLVGVSRATNILNSSAICDINSNMAGGIVGLSDFNSIIKNCYFGGMILPTSHGTWYGTVASTVYGGVVKWCYAKESTFLQIPVKEHIDCSDIVDFRRDNNEWILNNPVAFDGIDYDNLVDVMNKGVEFVNIPGLKTWRSDTTNINNGFPVFNNEYMVTCPNISNLHLRNIQQDTIHGVVVSWTDNENASRWQIRYRMQDSVDYTIHEASHNPDTLWNVYLGKNYCFSIRPVCNINQHGAWIDDVVFAVNTPYWIENVYTQPSGYFIDSDSNIIISSEEGLAWFISVVNGLNGQEANSLAGKRVTLTADVDMSQLRWTAIDGFSGLFDGGNHVITGIKINEQSNNQGFFGSIENADIKNVRLHEVSILALEKVGGLCGFTQRSKINNCIVTGAINGRNNIGGLIGELDNSFMSHCNATGHVSASINEAGGLVGTVRTHLSSYSDATPPVSCYIGNCFSSVVVRANNCAGGLIGAVYANLGDITIDNSYSRDSISESYINVGGFIGVATGYYSNKVIIRNCCSYTNVNIPFYAFYDQYPDEYLNGSFIGQCIGDVIVSKCYVKKNQNIDFIGSHHGSFDAFTMTDTSTISLINNVAVLCTPITINSRTYNRVEDALNMWVGLIASNEHNTWMADTSVDNTGMPVFGGQYLETCPPTVSIQTDTIWQNGIRVKWNNDENVNLWKIEYGAHGFERGDGINIYSEDTIIDIHPLVTGCYYDIYIQAICDENKLGRCDSVLCVKPDKPFWKDIVTRKPEGYQEDANGNIYISSAEGLAWLISVCDGLNGEVSHTFYNKVIYLTQNVDISAYRWTTIKSPFFSGTFNGLNHTITGLYINDIKDDGWGSAMFYTVGGTVKNVVLKEGIVKGEKYVAGICKYLHGTIENCNVESFVKGEKYVAGICIYLNGTIKNCGVKSSVESEKYAGVIAMYNNNQIINSYASGRVKSSDYVGGVLGWNGGIIQNCYSASRIESSMLLHKDQTTVRLGQFSGWDGVNNNQNIAYWHNSSYNISNLIRAANDYNGYYQFTGEDSVWTLTYPQFINGHQFQLLVDALNAWVDVNNAEENFRLWALDSTNVNGGFPVFAHIPYIPTTGSDSIVVCDSYTWHGDTYFNSTDLVDTLVTLSGCDSIVTHHLIVHHPIHTVTSVTECKEYTWAAGTGQTYTASGTYYYTHADDNNCTQVDTLYLTINHVTNLAYTVDTCDWYTWNGETYTTSGTYYHTHADDNNCTQVDTLYLTINHATNLSFTVDTCDWYTWNGETYTTSGTYYYTHADGNNCTQVDTLYLTINIPIHTAITETSCESYTWHNTTYTGSGTYTYTHEDANNCIQVDTLHLTINNPVHAAITETSCESYTWHNTTYTESGTYTYTHEDVNGCIQVDTLHLTINTPVYTAITETSCESYTWHNTTYTESGTYTYTHEDANGCTQVDTLHLTIDVDVVTEFTVTTADTCYIWNGQTYCTSGDYTQSFETVDGCDSVVTLHLTITVGIDDYDLANAMKLYPNPTSDLVNVQLTMNNEQLESIDIQVFDVYGRLLQVANVADARGASLHAQIDLSSYAKGVYFVKAVSEGKVIAVRKVVKQ